MESAITLFYQIVKMFIMMSVGYYLYKKSTINEDTTSRLSNILLMITTPCMIMSSFNQTYSIDKLYGLIYSFGLSFLIYLTNILFSNIVRSKNKEIDMFGVSFSNAGFLGIPLVSGLLGVEAVFYLAPFIALFYIISWTYGVVLMSNDIKNISPKKILYNPCIWAVVIGIIIFLLPVKPFTPIMESIQTLGNMTTPLAMIILGAYMAKTNLIQLFTNKQAYITSFYRLVVLPLILVFVFQFLPESLHEVRTVLLIGASAPVAVLAPIFATMFNKDTIHGSHIVCLSTILCLLTMPLMILLSEMIWL